MEIIYNAYVEQGYRKWTPADIYAAVSLNKYFRFGKNHGVITPPQANGDRTAELNDIFFPLYTTFSSIEHDMKRQLNHILKFMHSKGHLRAFLTTDINHLKSIEIVGSRVLYYQLAIPLVRCFPTADSGQLSTFHHIAVDPYNLESAYDILCMKDIFDEICSKDHRSKGYAVRLLFGDLYHMSIGTVQKSEGIRQLAEFSLMALTAEVIMGKMMEYCLRVDRVWRDMNCPIDTENSIVSDEGIFHKRFRLAFDKKEGEMRFV